MIYDHAMKMKWLYGGDHLKSEAFFPVPKLVRSPSYMVVTGTSAQLPCYCWAAVTLPPLSWFWYQPPKDVSVVILHWPLTLDKFWPPAKMCNLSMVDNNIGQHVWQVRKREGKEKSMLSPKMESNLLNGTFLLCIVPPLKSAEKGARPIKTHSNEFIGK